MRDINHVRPSYSMPLGALELGLFMKQGIGRFSPDFQTMLKSFLIPLALLPLSFVALYYSQGQRPEIASIPYEYLAFLFIGKFVLCTALGLVLLYAFAKYYDRLDSFFLAVSAGNWAGLVPTALFLPALFSMMMGWHSWEDIYPVMIVFSIYGYALSAFIITHALRIPWEMGGFLAICGMAINETGFDVVFWLAAP